MVRCRGGSEVVESVGWGGFGVGGSGVVGIGLGRGLGWGLLWCYGWGTLSPWLWGGEWDLGWGLLWCSDGLSSPHGFGANAVVGIWMGSGIWGGVFYGVMGGGPHCQTPMWGWGPLRIWRWEVGTS